MSESEVMLGLSAAQTRWPPKEKAFMAFKTLVRSTHQRGDACPGVRKT